MKSYHKIFDFLTVFFLIMSVIYISTTYFFAGKTGADGAIIGGALRNEVEWMGSVGLILSTLFSLMTSIYFRVTAKASSDNLPEDDLEAEIADGAGELGFFSPGSIFPFCIFVGAAITAYGVAFLLWWMVVVGGVVIIFSASAMALEYHVPRQRH